MGAHFEVHINGKCLYVYDDLFPLFGTVASHFHFYMWNQSMILHRLKIRTRNSKFNLETLRSKENPFVEFKYALGKLYQFKVQPVGHLNAPALAIRFTESPFLEVGMKKDKGIIHFEEARQYIQDNYYRKIDFIELSKGSFISFGHFAKKFKSLYGLTPKKYQTEWRLKQAKALLSNKKLKIREIGELIGFEDPANFQHLFKKKFKLVPGKLSSSENQINSTFINDSR